ncbi:MAG: hypothetical protein P9L94_09220 [Candidatus Hinthialibacter antarcticus]|nr:hypothetical protein [Candidatus Hinthialibacter antarcticus]
MKRKIQITTLFSIFLSLMCAAQTPRIESVVMLDPQPHENDDAVIWYDDFDTTQKYGESSGTITNEQHFGESGQSKLSHYEKGSRGSGGCKVFFGDSPTGNPTINRGKTYQDIYWRIYVKHQDGWQGGGPAKLSRATSLVTPNWAQAMIAHVWSQGESLTLDPARGVDGSTIVTERYNDFDHLKWLGNRPPAKMQIHSTEESGWWVCVESRAKLNTSGLSDGLNQLWLDGRLETERRNLNWRGSYTKHGINAVFLESYWNDGSPVTQSRWLDNFVVSTEPIGPVVCPRNPELMKTAFRGEGEQGGWELEVSSDEQGNEVVWKSQIITGGNQVRVSNETGQFVSSLSGENQLTPSAVYYSRVREQSQSGAWSDWSGWHQPIKTTNENSSIGLWKVDAATTE